MAMTQAARHRLYEALKEQIGVAPADTLMDAIPPVGWADVATKRDLDVLGNEIRGEVDKVRLEVRGEVDKLRLEVHQVRSDLRADLVERMNDLQRNLFFGLVAAQAGFAALVVNLLG